MLFRSLASLARAFAACVAIVLVATAFGRLEAATTSSQASALAPHLTTLANGMRVVTVVDRAAPAVQTSLWYRYGASDETAGKTGLAHALAHMMYRGTKSLSGSGLDDVFTHLGAQENATTTNDATRFTFLVPAKNLDLTLYVEADRMQHLPLDSATWTSERATIVAENDAALSQPLTRLYDRVCRAAAPARVCALSPLGDRGDLARVTTADLRTAYQTYYAPNNATLAIVGDIDEAAALATVRLAFEGIARREMPDRKASVPFFASGANVDLPGDFPYEIIDLAYPAPGSQGSETDAFAIIDSVVNNPRSDFHKGLIRSGYTLGYSTQYDRNAHDGLYHVFIVVAPGHSSAQARNAFVDILTSSIDAGFPADLVTAAKRNAERDALFARDSMAGIAERVGYAVAIDGATQPAGDAVARVTAADLVRVARRYLRAPAVTGLLTPAPGAAAVAPAPPATSVSDDFTRRTPSGPIVEARWVRAAIAPDAPIVSRARPTSFALPNGLRVVVATVRSNPTVYVTGAVETSPRFDPPGKTGLGAVVAQLVSRGSARYDFDAARKAADDLGASLDLGTSFSARGRASDLGALLDVIADDLAHPELTQASLAAVRAQTTLAIRERDGDVEERANHDFESELFAPGDASLREPTRATIANIGLGDVRAYARANLRPDLTTIVIVGDVDLESVRAIVTARFGDWVRNGPRPAIASAPLRSAHAASRYIVADRRSVDVHIGLPAVARTHADYDDLAVLSEVLGGGGAYDTRLVRHLHLERALVSDATSTLVADRDRGWLDIRLTATPATARDAVASVRHELQRLQIDPVGPFELERARSKIVARTLLAEQATATIAARVGRIVRDGLPLDDDATLGARFAAVDGARLLRAANRYLHPDQLIEIDEGPRP